MFTGLIVPVCLCVPPGINDAVVKGKDSMPVSIKRSSTHEESLSTRIIIDVVVVIIFVAGFIGLHVRRGLAQELVTAEKAADDDIVAEIDKFKP